MIVATIPIWAVVLLFAGGLLAGLPFLLRHLWPQMSRRTAWLLALGLALLFALVIAPTMVALSNNLRTGRSM